MGTMIEVNDTLQITTEQGFPVDVLNLERHQQNPITIEDVKDKVFSFKGKTSPRIFHLDPVRVFFYHNTEGKWLAWGEVVIQSQTIEKNPEMQHHSRVNESDPSQWVTSGTYKIIKVFDPEYQKLFTKHETPVGLSFFQ